MADAVPDIDADLASALVRQQFPQWAGLTVRPVRNGGWDNRTFHLGDDLLLRLPSAEGYAAQVEKEQTWLPRLAPHLPLPIPDPVAMGEPGLGYPWRWSVYRWIEGQPANAAPLPSPVAFAQDLAAFLTSFHSLDARNGPPPGLHNYFRGASPAVYGDRTLQAIDLLTDRARAETASDLWRRATATAWTRPPVWVHGDLAAGNLLIRDGRLAAVIDFGCLAVGDPACDLVPAWTMLPRDARAVFRAALDIDDDTWVRAQAWALWKALILSTGLAKGPAADVALSHHVLGELLG